MSNIDDSIESKENTTIFRPAQKIVLSHSDKQDLLDLITRLESVIKAYPHPQTDDNGMPISLRQYNQIEIAEINEDIGNAPAALRLSEFAKQHLQHLSDTEDLYYTKFIRYALGFFSAFEDFFLTDDNENQQQELLGLDFNTIISAETRAEYLPNYKKFPRELIKAKMDCLRILIENAPVLLQHILLGLKDKEINTTTPVTTIIWPLDKLTYIAGQTEIKKHSGEPLWIALEKRGTKKPVSATMTLRIPDYLGEIKIQERHIKLMATIHSYAKNGYSEISIDNLYRILHGLSPRSKVSDAAKKLLEEDLRLIKKVLIRVDITEEVQHRKWEPACNNLGIQPNKDKRYILEDEFVPLSFIIEADKNNLLTTQDGTVAAIRIKAMPPLMQYAMMTKRVTAIPVRCLNDYHSPAESISLNEQKERRKSSTQTIKAQTNISRYNRRYENIAAFILTFCTRTKLKESNVDGQNYNECLMERIYELADLDSVAPSSRSVLKSRINKLVRTLMDEHTTCKLIPGYTIRDKEGAICPQTNKRGGKRQIPYKLRVEKEGYISAQSC